MHIEDQTYALNTAMSTQIHFVYVQYGWQSGMYKRSCMDILKKQYVPRDAVI